MRVLISGGSGFVGTALAADWLAGGHEVLILTRGGGAPVAAGARALVWDGRTAAGWWSEADGCDAIVHLAGENIGAGRWTRARKERIRRSRVDSGAALVDAVGRMRRRPAVLVQMSGVDLYGERGDEVLVESSPSGGDFVAGVVADWEASTAAVEELGVRRPVARTGLVLAANGGALPQLARPFRWFVGGPLAGGRQWLPWIHLADTVRALRCLAENPTARGPFHLTAPGIVRQRDFARVIGRVLRRPSFVPAPEFALRLVLGEMADLVVRSHRCVPAALERLGFSFHFPALEAALADVYGRGASP